MQPHDHPLRVVITALHYYPDRPSGSSRLAFDEAVYLAERGHEVWIVAMDPTGRQPEYAFREGLHVLQYPAPSYSLFDPRRAQAHQQQVRDLLLKHTGEPVDALHGHALLAYDGARAIYSRPTRRAYSIHSPMRLEMEAAARGAGPAQRLKLATTGHLTHSVEARCLAASDRLTAESQYTRTLIGQYHSPEIAAQVQVIPGWVDVNRFQIQPDRDALKARFDWPQDVPVLFTLRRLVPRNGLDVLLRGLHQLCERDHAFHMVIGGGGPLLDDLQEQAQMLGIADRVRFVGRVDDDDLPLMYAAADAFVLPTSALECFGLIMLEALACGRPVLATPVGAIPEVMWQVEASWLSQDASPGAIADLLAAFLAGELPRHEPQALRRFVEANYASERIIPQLVRYALEIE